MSSVFHDTEINNCKLIINKVFSDKRGEFSEIYKRGPLNSIKQVNYSHSFGNVFRGIHQTPYGKLISCVSGSILDICVDLREKSSTFLKVVVKKLDPIQMNSLYIPPNCGHGFYALTDSVIIYAQEDIYSDETNINHHYSKFSIDIPELDFANISEKDKLQ